MASNEVTQSRTTAEPRARILVVDDEPAVRTQLREIFELHDYEVHAATGVGEVLAENARRAAQHVRPHVAVVDMRLDDDLLGADKRGIDLLFTLDSAAGVLYSAYIQPEDLRRLSGPKHKSWVHKRERAEKLVEMVEEGAVARSARRAGVTIEWHGLPTEKEMLAEILPERDEAQRRLPPGILDDIVWQLYADQKPTRIFVQPLHTPRDGVYAASRDSSTVVLTQTEGRIPYIIKFTGPEQMAVERANYRDHVDGRFFGNFHTHLIETTHFWDLGGAMYSLVGADGKQVSFTARFADPAVPVDELARPLRHLFSETFALHYRSVEDNDREDLLTYYDRVFDLRRKLADPVRVNRMQGCLRVGATDPTQFVADELAAHCPPGYLEGVTHGDLHGDNLFLDHEHAWLIDFGRTGRGHALRDFIELEVDIVTRLLLAGTLDDMHAAHLAMALAKPAALTEPIAPPDAVPDDPLLAKAIALITLLRATAQACVPDKDTIMQEYMVGALCNCVYVAALNRIQEAQRRRAVCYATAIVERLRRTASNA